MPPLLPAKTIYVCSPDTRHFSEWKKHLQRGGTFFIPCWSQKALAASQPYLAPHLTPETLWDRMDIVGPFPRRVCGSADDYDEAKKQIDTTMEHKESEVTNVLVHGAGGVDAEHDKDKPLSSVFGFDVEPGSNYTKRTVDFVSDHARLQLSMATLLSTYTPLVRNTDTNLSTALGRSFESTVFRLLASGWETTMERIGEGNTREGSEQLTVKGTGRVKRIESGLGLYHRVYQAMKAMPLCQGGTSEVVCFASNFPVIDAADARNRGFSITVGRKKKIW